MISSKFPVIRRDGGNYTAFRCECGQSLDGSWITGILHFMGEPHFLSQKDAEKAWRKAGRLLEK